jgi:chromosome segregation ATPase
MQKNLAAATEAIADGLNELHESKRKSLFELIKKQASELERRGKMIERLESSLQLQQKNIHRLLEQNKHLESMLLSLKEEREKLFDEIKDLKQKRKTTRVRKIKEKAGDDRAA